MAATQVQSITREALNEPEAIPISVKEMLAKLAGAFPFDEAVVEGKSRSASYCTLVKTNLVFSLAERKHVSVRRAFWHKCLDDNRESRRYRCRRR
jgi:hypothetical protein